MTRTLLPALVALLLAAPAFAAPAAAEPTLEVASPEQVLKDRAAELDLASTAAWARVRAARAALSAFLKDPARTGEGGPERLQALWDELHASSEQVEVIAARRSDVRQALAELRRKPAPSQAVATRRAPRAEPVASHAMPLP